VIHELSGSATQAFAPVQAAFVLAALGLVVIAAWQRPPAPVLTYLIAGFVLAVGTSNVHASIARFLLPIFPILVPIAMLLDRLGRRIAVPVLILTAGVSALIGAWYFTAGSFAP
jgi:hydrogenase-4 membrane subunit HyfE